MKIVHVVPSIEEEASGPAYSVPSLSRAVVAISESTRAALLASVRCDPAKVRVIHNNVSGEFRPAPRAFNAACPRILQVGTAWNKNLDRVAEALADMSCRLVIIGPLSDDHVAMLRRHDIDHENHVALSRAALVAQYEAADMLLFVSTYEGFGLPIVEAQAVGRPVVTSDILSMPEVAGGGACLVDPFDVAGIRAGVRRIIDDPGYREGLIAMGLENARQFSAAHVAEQYAALYREVAAGCLPNMNGEA